MVKIRSAQKRIRLRGAPRGDAFFRPWVKSDVHSFSWASALCSVACHGALVSAILMWPHKAPPPADQMRWDEFAPVAVAIVPVVQHQFGGPAEAEKLEMEEQRKDEMVEPSEELEAGEDQSLAEQMGFVEPVIEPAAESDVGVQANLVAAESSVEEQKHEESGHTLVCAPDHPEGRGEPASESAEMAASGVPIVSGSAIETSNYWSVVRSRIADAIRYPETARRLNVEGGVNLRLTLARDGAIREMAVNDDANRILADACLAAAGRAAPFPNPPPEIATLSAEIWFRFQLLDAEKMR